MRDVVLLVQILTYISLGVVLIVQGHPRLGAAQVLSAVIAGLIFGA